MIPQWEQDIINSKIKKYVYVIDWLDQNENTIEEITVDVVEGSLNFDSKRNSRRSARMVLNNINGIYVPSANGKLWIDNRFKIKAGYEYDDGQYLLYNQGTYVLGNPTLTSLPAIREVEIEGLDKWTLLDGTIAGRLETKYQIDVGTRVDVVIKDLITTIAGENRYIIDECDTTLPYTITKEPGNTISDIILEICNIVSYISYFDNNGVFRFRPYIKPEDYAIIPPSWYYTVSGLYLGSRRNLKWLDVKNKVKVIGDTLSDGTVIEAVSEQITGDVGTSSIGERLKKVEDSNIWTVDLAQQRANYELQQSLRIAEEDKITLVPNFSHLPDDIINNTDESNGLSGNYVIQTINYNLSNDTEMTLGLWGISDE